jgi:ribosome-associated protein
LESKDLASLIAELSLEKKATDVVILNLKEITTITDYFVILSADSDVQAKAIADHLTEQLKTKQIKVWHTEGYSSLKWVLLDLVDVVVHIFQLETRQYYNLEKLWGDAEITRVEDK